jgi:hypothetical protein
MPGGAAVELEIAMPQYRYVALASKWFNAVRSGAPIAIHRRSRRQISRFSSGTGFLLQPIKIVRVISQGIQWRYCA